MSAGRCVSFRHRALETLPKNYIGYEDETYYYLLLDVSHKAVKRLCGEQDEGFAISAKSLAKALVDEGLIEQDESGTNTKTMRFGGQAQTGYASSQG